LGYATKKKKAVRSCRGVCSHPIYSFIFSKDQKVRLYDWDGKALQEVGLLEANKGLVSALAFSPDGLKLAAGDVSKFLVCFLALLKKRVHVCARARALADLL
jgi:WD40 repeat protein